MSPIDDRSQCPQTCPFLFVYQVSREMKSTWMCSAPRNKCAARPVTLKEKTTYLHCRPMTQVRRAQQHLRDAPETHDCRKHYKGRIPRRLNEIVPKYSSKGPTGSLDSAVALVCSFHPLRTAGRQPRGRNSNNGRQEPIVRKDHLP